MRRGAENKPIHELSRALLHTTATIASQYYRHLSPPLPLLRITPLLYQQTIPRLMLRDRHSGAERQLCDGFLDPGPHIGS